MSRWKALCLRWRARRILLHVWLGGRQEQSRIVWARFMLDGVLRNAEGRRIFPRRRGER